MQDFSWSSKHPPAEPEALGLAALKGAQVEALHLGSTPSPAPQAQWLLAPRFSVGWPKPTAHPESRRDGAHALRPSHIRARRSEKHNPGTTPVNVKLLLPPRQSRGFSQSNRKQTHLPHRFKFPNGSDQPQTRRARIMNPSPILAFECCNRSALTTTAARSTATTRTTRTAAAAAAIAVVGLRRTARANRLAGHDRRSVNTVEVRLALLVELLATLLLKVVSAFDEDCALVRLRLPFIELIARPGRCGWSFR
jgi:hypothetical protein